MKIGLSVLLNFYSEYMAWLVDMNENIVTQIYFVNEINTNYGYYY
jgi:hypothetical protein